MNMKLYIEILSMILAKERILITFPDLKLSAREIIDSESYNALQKIKTIIENDSLADPECFLKIEEIVCTFEALGSNGGNRHDFG